MIDWIKYKKVYFSISAVALLISVFGLFVWGVKFGVDFTGGAIIEYRMQGDISTEKLTTKLMDEDFVVNSIQSIGSSSYLFKFPPIESEQKEKITKTLVDAYPDLEIEELKFEVVGPSIGPELVKKTLYALSIAAVLILIWIAFQFKNFEFGISAIMAMLHDSFILFGSYSLLGYFFGVEVDFLLITAILTTLSFSVHDTIVVFDRVREIMKKEGGDLENVVNRALTETMVRSLNNSFTIMFMLVALSLMGGTTIRWFAVSLLIGTLLGTYSSPFVAVPLLVTFKKWRRKLKK